MENLEIPQDEGKQDTIPVDKMFRVIFKQNRTFELFIGRNMYTFSPNEEKLLKESEVKSDDFKNQRKFFTVIE